MDPLKTLSNYLKSLGKAWQPNGGTHKIRGIWDGKSFNLRYFAEYSYVVILGNEEEIYYYLLELDSEQQARSFWKHNQVGTGCFRILELSTGIVVAEWYHHIVMEPRDERTKCVISFR